MINTAGSPDRSFSEPWGLVGYAWGWVRVGWPELQRGVVQLALPRALRRALRVEHVLREALRQLRRTTDIRHLGQS